MEDGENSGSWGEEHGNMTCGGDGDGYLCIFESVDFKIWEMLSDVATSEEMVGRRKSCQYPCGNSPNNL